MKFEDLSQASAQEWLSVPSDWRNSASKTSFDLFWDKDRLYGQVLPRPSAAEIKTFYEIEDYYTHSTVARMETERVNLLQKVQTRIAWWCDRGTELNGHWWAGVLKGEKLRILEIGCGNGKNLRTFEALGHEVVGVEPDPVALGQAHENGFRVFSGTAERLPSEVLNEKFNVIVFLHVLEHCLDPQLAVENAADLLVPGGKLVAEVPNNECIGANHFQEVWYWLDVPRHINFFTKLSLEDLAVAANLQLDSTYYRGFTRQFSPDWKSAQKSISLTFGISHDRRVSGAAYWKLLISSLFRRDQEKYDSVGIVAVRS